MVSTVALGPWANTMRLDESSRLRNHCYADRFSVVRVETTGPLAEPIHKSSCVPALLLSTFMKAVSASDYRLWFDGKLVPIGQLQPFRVNVVDLQGEPEMWGQSGIDYVHFHVRQRVIDETAAALGYERVGKFRLAVAQDDMVLAQLTKSVSPFLEPDASTSPLALEQLELIVAAHVIQRYGAARQKRFQSAHNLAPWQRRRATELLRENLEGKVALADVARVCELSVSHFARSFKATFGISPHRWLTEQRIERAQSLLAKGDLSLADIARQAGFGDQPSFTRAFRQAVGATPARWRRERKRA